MKGKFLIPFTCGIVAALVSGALCCAIIYGIEGISNGVVSKTTSLEVTEEENNEKINWVSIPELSVYLQEGNESNNVVYTLLNETNSIEVELQDVQDEDLKTLYIMGAADSSDLFIKHNNDATNFNDEEVVFEVDIYDGIKCNDVCETIFQVVTDYHEDITDSIYVNSAIEIVKDSNDSFNEYN